VGENIAEKAAVHSLVQGLSTAPPTALLTTHLRHQLKTLGGQAQNMVLMAEKSVAAGRDLRHFDDCRNRESPRPDFAPFLSLQISSKGSRDRGPDGNDACGGIENYLGGMVHDAHRGAGPITNKRQKCGSSGSSRQKKPPPMAA
jgi:hypothetical protein